MTENRVPQQNADSSENCSASCCATAPVGADFKRRAASVRTAFQLEGLTIGWMSIEAVVAIWSGLAAVSISLLAFGIDSLIELASAGVLIWRLNVELRRGQAFGERAEQIARQGAGGLLLTLAVYVVASAGWKLWTRTGETFSWPGLMVTLIAIPAMYFLARRKIIVAEEIGSRALRADAMEAITCGWLSVVVVIGLLANAVTGAWWIDAVTSLAIVWLLVKEGREAWASEDCC